MTQNEIELVVGLFGVIGEPVGHMCPRSHVQRAGHDPVLLPWGFVSIVRSDPFPKNKCRFLATWHLTREPATATTPHEWTVTKYDCTTGIKTKICRTSPTWDDNWARPADELGAPPINAENAGTTCP